MATVVRHNMNMDKLYESYRLKLEWIREECANGDFTASEEDNFYESDM